MAIHIPLHLHFSMLLPHFEVLLKKLQWHVPPLNPKPTNHEATPYIIFGVFLFIVHVIMNFDFLEEIQAKARIAHKKVLTKCKVVVLFDLLHCLLHSLFELDGRAITL